MNVTKQKILKESLKLFNKNGVSNVSLRNIADEVGISVGNLQYHFNKREEILESLYFELVEKNDAISIEATEDLLKSFLNISKEIMAVLFEYHFFFLDFVAITRNNQIIKSHYAKLSKRREQEFLQIAEILIKNNVFRKEKLKNEYHNLYKRVEVISNFWFSSLLIQSKVLSKKSVASYSILISQSIYPYLTDDAKKQYAIIYPHQML